MELYFAGFVGKEFNVSILQPLVRTRLVSYHYVKDTKLEKLYLETKLDNYDKIFIDSGAYSAWTTGKEIDIDDYIQFLLKHQHKVEYIANLDVIPGKPNQKRISLSEVERSARQGYENYLYMLDKGIDRDKLIHVFHQNESFKWLEKMLEDGLTYIGISPANDRKTKEKIMWLDRVMEIICDSNGYPVVKFHGFGITSFLLMSRYPWSSVDSSTWTIIGGRGMILLPLKRGNKWIYPKIPLRVTVSRTFTRRNYYKSMPKTIQNNLFEYLEMHNIPLGKSEFVLVNKDYKLQKNERFCSNTYVKSLKLGAPPAGKRWVERVIEDGILVNWAYRMYLNAYYMLEFIKTLEEPARFKHFKSPSFGFIF